MNDYIKRKKQKHVEKKTESQFLINIFNDILRWYDFSVSIHEILQRNKVNIFWMNLIIWFSVVCKEFKRLCTYVTKKKGLKTKQSQQIQSESLNIEFQFVSTFKSNYDDQMLIVHDLIFNSDYFYRVSVNAKYSIYAVKHKCWFFSSV